MAISKLVACLLASFLVRTSSTSGGCPSDDALGSAVCEEVLADADSNGVGMQLLQVDKVRVMERKGTMDTTALQPARTNATDLLKTQEPITALGQAATRSNASINASIRASVKSSINSNSKAGLPGFGDIIGQVVDQVNDIGQSAKQVGAEAIRDFAGTASTAAVVEVAGALNKTLLSLDSKAVVWRADCYGLLEKVVDGMNATFNDSIDELKAYELHVSASINKFLPYWHKISDGVRVTTMVASGVLKTLGQDSYVLMLNESVSFAMSKTSAVVDSLLKATKLMSNISGLARAESVKALLYINATLENALDYIEEYAEQLEIAFEDLTDQAAAGLESTVIGVNATAVDDAFGSVRLTAARVVHDLFNGPAAVVTGLSEATTGVEARVGAKSSTVMQRPLALLLLAMLPFAFGL